jgi:subtilisin family serine protease
MRWRRLVGGALAGGLVCTVLLTGNGTGTASEAAGGAERSVTLITGDRVTVAGGLRSVVPGPGREGMSFYTNEYNGKVHVIPADAARLVGTGRLDRRLFDVTSLIAEGYDDAARDTLPVIVTATEGQRVALRAAGRDLPSINGIALDVAKNATSPLWNEMSAAGSGINRIWFDATVRATLDHSVPRIGAPAAWDAGYTGTGTTVAVLDTGVDQTHPDLASREVAERNFTESPDSVDRFGHGTHVASIVAGNGPKYRGVAHGASILDGKVLDDSGRGKLSWAIAGMEWAVAQGADVVNLSLGAEDSPGEDPMEAAVNALSAEHGTLFVIAAGNSGPGQYSLGSPGTADAALTVGAVDREDRLAQFSSRGPRVDDGAIKPDITAPGVDIVAALHAEGAIGEPVEPGYVALSGTSMATPHVAGAAALLAQKNPQWTGSQLKAALTASARNNPESSPYEQGSGRVDVAAALDQTVTTEPTSVSLGTAAWPHDDDQPVTREFTYRNAGPTEVTLRLALETTAPAGMFTLNTEEVTVPAGGTAAATVTGDPRVATVDGPYGAAIVATAGETRVTTPVAIDRERERHDLTLDIRDRSGNPAADYEAFVYGLDEDLLVNAYDEDGTPTVRLPVGDYVVAVSIKGEGVTSHLVHAPLALTADATVVLDARTAEPVKVTPPDPKAELALFDIGYVVLPPDRNPLLAAILADDTTVVETAHSGAGLPADQFVARVNTQWTRGTDFYGLAWFQEERLPTGFERTVTRRELATVHATVAPTARDRVPTRLVYPQPPGRPLPAYAVPMAVEGGRTEYYNVDGVHWTSDIDQLNPETGELESSLTSSPRAYRAGRTYREQYQGAVLGPAFPAGREWVRRTGDELALNLPLFSDAAGNAGLPAGGSGNTKLYRDGQLVGEAPAAGSGRFPVTAGTYRLTTEGVRADAFDLSTRVSAEWTFRLGRTGPAPLSAIRFTPRLSADNSAPADRPTLVPVRMQAVDGTQLRPRDLTVEASFDGGHTWRRVQVLGPLGALVVPPKTATSVSLRASAGDQSGNTVTQTVVDAYRLTAR